MRLKHSFVDDAVRDIIEELNLWEELYDTEKVYGRCINESESKNLTKEDYAFRFNNPTETSLATSYLFPNRFPTDFSVLIVAKQLPGTIPTNFLVLNKSQ